MSKMSDQELADKVVALGVGIKSDQLPDVLIPGFFAIDDFEVWDGVVQGMCDEDPFMEPAEFVRDWRVAGALMEKHPFISYQRCADCVYVTVDEKEIFVDGAESLPLAIIEACVEAYDSNLIDSLRKR